MSERYKPIVDFLQGEPTPEQWTAISWPLEPSVVVAGAGSGKTSVMAARVIYLAMVATGAWPAEHEGVMPGNVFCLTFTNKATENLILKMRRALRTLDLDEGEEPEISNYHAFAAQVLERHGMLIGLEPGQRVLSQAQRAQIAARVLDRMTFETLHTRWQPAIVGYILGLDEQLQNHLVEPETVVEHVEGKLDALRKARSAEPLLAAEERVEIARAVRVFRDIKAELGVIDFGDQIAHAVRIASEFPDVGRAYRDRFGAVLLDEYQDTNHAQAVLMRAVFGAGHPVTAVGDPDQNIYAWRGASLWNLLHFRKEFPLSDGSESAQLPLYTNFRSGARILQAADKVIDALPANQRPDPDKLLRPWERNGDGRVEVARYEHEVAEAEGVAERAHANGVAWRTWRSCRTHRLFRRSSRRRDGVPAFVNLAGLIHLPEIVEVLAYARATEDPKDGVALARILTGPRYRVGLRDLGALAGWSRAKGATLREVLSDLAFDEDDGLFEDTPSYGGSARGSRRGSGTHRRGTRSPRRVPRRARRAPRGGATSRRRVPGRDHPPDRPARRARLHRGPADGARETSEPRRVPRAGARVPTGRRRAHAPRVPRSHRLDRRRPRVEPGAAERRRLDEGDDGARVQGARVRGGVRPGSGERTVPRHAGPAEPGAQGELARRRAPARA
jgi:DNA helicase-2/ATP-dependent DNA helicase PcrA